MPDSLAQRLRAQLHDLEPLAFDLEDQSAAHAGHAGAKAGAHLRLHLVSAQFAGRSRVERHRMVYERLAPLFQGQVHALTMELRAPDEVKY